MTDKDQFLYTMKIFDVLLGLYIISDEEHYLAIVEIQSRYLKSRKGYV